MHVVRRTCAALATCLLLLVAGWLLLRGGEGDRPAARKVDPASFPAGSTMRRLAERGGITVGTRFDQPLFGALGPRGKPEGFDVEMAKIIAAELGIAEENIVWVRVFAADRERVIEAGRADLVIATYTITDGRKRAVDFAGPYYTAGQTILVRDGNNEIKRPADLAGRGVCTAVGSTPADVLRSRYPQARLHLVAEYTECLEPLRNGQIDAVSTDNVILSGLIHQNPGEFKLVGGLFTSEPYGIALRKGDPDFREFINDVIERSYASGSWRAAWERTAGAVLDTPVPPPVDRRQGAHSGERIVMTPHSSPT
jgi:glutamate transport system substrate-binding protein